ncbi:hypothetical protein NA56DRAFT_695850 [Hyaloscypha hepaticicola]|uniref:Uncharacterized protein n=1 Tax=Hyaloscypha hepaticicola TaxID=2082293 RepID=A0A2J6QPA4_9HELO|nr:hypothetical protein NA56DRAFT_695850 [Hyaloscypha hepaticicola]
MSVNSYRRVDLHAFIELRVTVRSRFVPVRVRVRPSWTTASRHGVVVHHRPVRGRRANYCTVQYTNELQKIMAAVRTIRARLMHDRATHRFSNLDAKIAVLMRGSDLHSNLLYCSRWSHSIPPNIVDVPTNLSTPFDYLTNSDTDAGQR